MFNVNGYVLLSHSRCKQHETTETELLVTTLTVSITLQLSSNVSSVSKMFFRSPQKHSPSFQTFQ